MMVLCIHQYAFSDDYYETISLVLSEEMFAVCLPNRTQKTDKYPACAYLAPKEKMDDNYISVLTHPLGKEAFENVILEEGRYFDVKISDNAWKALVCNLLKYKNSNSRACRINSYYSEDFFLFDLREE